tara:strand:- start:246 stop:404 length:159 start_codon:yes stop_codon:yes gene_type:complete
MEVRERVVVLNLEDHIQEDQAILHQFLLLKEIMEAQELRQVTELAVEVEQMQ